MKKIGCLFMGVVLFLQPIGGAVVLAEQAENTVESTAVSSSTEQLESTLSSATIPIPEFTTESSIAQDVESTESIEETSVESTTENTVDSSVETEETVVEEENSSARIQPFAVDVTKPVINIDSIKVDKTEVSVGDKVTVSVEITDDMSGINSSRTYIQLKHVQSGKTSPLLYATYNNKTQRYEFSMDITENTAEGQWMVNSVSSMDNNGNDEWISLRNKGLFTVKNTNKVDVTKPVINIDSIKVDKTEVSVGDKVTISVEITDDMSGVNSSRTYIQLKHVQSGKTSPLLYATYNNKTQRYEFSMDITENTAEGQWMVNSVSSMDNNGNDEWISLTNKGLFTVKNTNKVDVTKPVINIDSIKVDKTEVSVGDKVTVSVEITDDMSGVNSSRTYIQLKHVQSGKTSPLLYATYNNKTQRYEFSMDITENTAEGQWMVNSVSSMDNNGNDEWISLTNKDIFEVIPNDYTNVNKNTDAIWVTSSESWNNQTIESDLYIGPDAVLTLTNSIVKGTIYVYGGLNATSIQAKKLYAQTIQFGYVYGFYNGLVSLKGSNSISSMVSTNNYNEELPLRIDDKVLRSYDGVVSFTGAYVPVKDLYFEGKKIDTTNGRFIIKNLKLKDPKKLSVQFIDVWGNKTSKEIAVLPSVKSTDGTGNASPEITGQKKIELNRGDKFTLANYFSASDYEDGDLTKSLIVNKTVDTAKLGTEKYTVSVVDSKGLKTTYNFEVSIKASFSTSNFAINLSDKNIVYDGKAKTPTVTVKDGNTTLKQDTDYTVSYTNNTKVGQATAKITGKGNYSGTLEKTFAITAKALKETTVALSSTTFTYDGKAKTPTVTVKDGNTTLKQDTDYTVSYTNNTKVGQATAKITGKGNYSGNLEKTFTITAKSLKELAVTLSEANAVYDGKAKKPVVTVKDGNTILKQETDYTVSYTNNTKVGQATVKIIGKGNYSDTIEKGFTITIKSVENAVVTLSSTTFTYDGKAKVPTVTVKDENTTLKQETDYTVFYMNNTKAGKAAIKITGKGNYGGVIEKGFTIAAKELNAASFELSSPSFIYDGKAKTPTITVKDGNTTLKQETDYTVSYANNTKVGQATVKITGKGNYSGSLEKTFAITAKALKEATVALLSTTFTYDGKVKVPTVTVKDGNTTLKQETDYVVSYANNTKVGQATAKITGKGNYSGILEKTFTITEKSLKELTVTLSETSFVYDGKAKTPTITINDGNITLKPDIDYSFVYKNNIGIGTAEIELTGNGNYTGIKTVTFEITNRKLEVQFESNGGTAIKAQLIHENEKVTQPEKPIKKDYKFDGWYTDEKLEKAYNFNSLVTSNQVLYAKWIKESKVGPYQSYGKYVTIKSKNYDIWQNFDWKKRDRSSKYYGQVVMARGYYEHTNGARYLTLYDNNGNWIGYMNETGTTVSNNKMSTYQSYGKYVTIKSKNYDIWQNFNWKKRNHSSKYYGQVLLAKGYYTHYNGARYLTLYDNKGNWIGYMNETGTTVSNNKVGSYQSYGKYVTIKSKNYDIWQNFNWKKRSHSSKYYNKKVLAKGYYVHYNGARYLTLYDNKGNWIGYMNETGTTLAK